MAISTSLVLIDLVPSYPRGIYRYLPICYSRAVTYLMKYKWSCKNQPSLYLVEPDRMSCAPEWFTINKLRVETVNERYFWTRLKNYGGKRVGNLLLRFYMSRPMIYSVTYIWTRNHGPRILCDLCTNDDIRFYHQHLWYHLVFRPPIMLSVCVFTF